MISERGISLCHSTIVRWVHQYGTLFDKKIRKKLNKTRDSWKLGETYVKVKGKWKYLDRAVDKEGNIFDFYLSVMRNKFVEVMRNKFVEIKKFRKSLSLTYFCTRAKKFI